MSACFLDYPLGALLAALFANSVDLEGMPRRAVVVAAADVFF